MSINARLQQLLARHPVPYELVPHPEAFTAQRVAQSCHLAGRNLAKVVVAKAPGSGYVMAVLPASCHLDLDRLGKIRGHGGLTLASELQIERLFPDCEPGAMPPFGHLYDLPLYLDACFHEHERIWFQAGNHREVIGMAIPDYERLAWPIAAIECMHAMAGAAA